MDSPEIREEELEKMNKNSLGYRVFRSCFALAFSLLTLFLLFFCLLYLAVLIGNLSIWNPVSVASRCKIVSSSVDLRSTKVCELGLLNYKAKHVFHPRERKKYRCHYDYYWASIFEVNETYGCWYTLGIPKVHIDQDGLFNCHAKDPSTVEMLRRYSILFTRILKTWLAGEGSIRIWRWDIIAGLLTGFSTSLISITLVGLIRPLKSFISRIHTVRTLPLRSNTVLLKRAFLLVVYISFMSWVTIQYLKRLGLPLMI
ncbi:uncharacterized protein LOC111398590 isoform X3 [Olea europaea var. sylvestris]|uniref:uncharacterized protein LOC111398590 isoform X3 n=1 Tax=Olea europaea var. sylvestris TaxID=158386 RepID=UPI000C1CF8EC|nr:uncharacterized protein LOC111398590 isoform X3 [Olea europaea var. sylvestris]